MTESLSALGVEIGFTSCGLCYSEQNFHIILLFPPESLPQTSPAIIAVGVIAAVICLIVIAVVTYFIIRRQEPSRDYDG